MATDVLLIDDDPDTSSILRQMLIGHDYQIRTAFSGSDGIRACRDRKPDVVILDLRMPGVDGWEVCERIRQFSDVPILVISALGAPANVARALDAGADDYLIKPVHGGMLASRLSTLVRRSVVYAGERAS